jgi:hypothetical protein
MLTDPPQLKLVHTGSAAPPPRDSATGERPASREVVLGVAGLAVGVGSLIAAARYDGLYAQSAWAPVALVALSLLLAVALISPVRLTRSAMLASGALVALLAWAALSMLWAPSTDRAWTEVNRLVLYVAALGLGLLCARSRRAAQLLVGGFGAASVALGLYIVARMSSGSGAGLFLDFRLSEPVNYANGQAGLLLMGAVCVFGLAERGRSVEIRVAAAAGCALLASLAVMTQSRSIIPAVLALVLFFLLAAPGRLRRLALTVSVGAGVAVALPSALEIFGGRVGAAPGSAPDDAVLRGAATWSVAAAAVTGILWWAHIRWLEPIRLDERVRRAIGTALIALCAVGALGAWVAADDPAGRISARVADFKALKGDDPTARGRFSFAGGYRYDLWRIAVEEFKERPVAGVGAGNYVSGYLTRRRTGEYVRQPHSIVLQVLAELGLAGGLMLALFAGGVLLAVVRPAAGTPTAERPELRLAAGGVFVAWLAYTSFDWLYNLPALSIAAFGCAGLLLGSRPARVSAGAPARRLVAIGLVLAVAISAASVGRQYAALLTRQDATAVLPRDAGQAERRALAAIALNAGDVDAHYVLAAARARMNRYEDARGALLQAAEREPFNYVPWTLLGDLALRRGDAEQARSDYARARQLNPFDQALGAPVEQAP